MKLRNIITCIFAFVFVLTLVGCNNTTPPHEHEFVNGECSCGESDPNFVPPHEHNFVNGTCSCGEKDPNYQEPKEEVIWRWTIDGEVVKEEIVEVGITPETPEAPENAAEGYRWMKMDYYENGKLCYEFILLWEVKICKITFVNQYGEILKEQKLEWGSDALAPVYPENYSVKWDKDFVHVTEDMVITGEIKKLYASIAFYDGDTKLDLGINKYNMGDEFELPIPVKDGYDFIGWYLADISLYSINKITKEDEADFVFYARYMKNDFSDISLPSATGRITQINQNGNYLTPVVAGSTTSYSWVVSDDSIIGVSEWGSISVRSCGVAVLTAVFKENPSTTYNCLVEATSTGVRIVTEEELKQVKLHTVKFLGKDNEVIDEQIVPNGYTATYPVPLSYDGFAFDGWDKDVCNITSDTVIKAKYATGTNRFEGKTMAILGDSISTYLNYMPEGYAHFYPYPAGNIRDVNHTWWKQVSNAIGTSVFVDNSWGGTTVVGGDSATESPVRLNTLLHQGIAPDIVLIFMGTNDARAKYTNATFEASYRKMIANIKKIAPDAEIIVCTLMDFSATNFYEAKTKDDYNAVIKKVASDNNISVIDLKDVELLKADLIDSVHPNYSGHKKMADVIIKQLKELR